MIINKSRLSFILACTSLLFSINTYAETFSTSINNNCKVHNQFPVSGETIEYEGECKEGFASGIGKVKWYANGKLHQISGGNYIKGKLEGECNIQVVNSKHSFTGACKDDAPSNGTYTYEDGSVYVGEFEYGKPKGKATRK